MKQILIKKTFTNALLNLGNRTGIRWKGYYYFIALINIIRIAKNWPRIIFNKVYRSNNSLIDVELRNGIKVSASEPADLSMLTEIWAIEEYTPEGFRINAKDTVLDIGAHYGFFTLYASYLAKSGKIYSFEPFKKNYEMLEKNLKRNNIKNVEPLNFAVSAESGWRDFYPFRGHNGCHSLYDRGSGQKIRIKTISLKDIFSRYNLARCDFLKMDCEGAEFEIILNTKRPVLRRIKYIVGELHTDLQKKYSKKDLVNHLKSNGFHILIANGCFYARNLMYKKDTR